MSNLNKTKLVQVIADSQIGGGPKHVLGILNNIDKEKFDVLLIAPRGWLTARAAKIKDLNVKIIEFRNKFDLSSFIKLRKTLAEFRSEGDPFTPFIIHAHGPRAANFCRYALAQKDRFIYTEHIWSSSYQLRNPLNSWVQRSGLGAVAKRADRIIAVSKSVKQFLSHELKVDDNKIKVISNGIEIDSDARKTSKDQSKLLIGTIGSLNKQKGQIYLIRAFAKVAQSLPKARLEIIGDGEEKELLKREIDKLDLESKIQLLGKIDKPKKILRNWDLFVLPSLSETFGLVILEAFEAKVPVIASNVGGIPELVKNEETGLLVPPADIDKLAKSILYLLVEKKVREKLSENAHGLLKDKFDWSKIIKEIEAEYSKLVR